MIDGFGGGAMLQVRPSQGPSSAAGGLLRHWRQHRRLSQLELAFQAEVSARHISFIETGRAVPSRAMVLILCSALAVPLRERNALLQAAGYAPVYRETALATPEMADIRRALELILRQHGPHGGAVALDRHWDIMMANVSFSRLTALLLGPAAVVLTPFEVTKPPRLNLFRLLFEPGGCRAHIANWEEVAGTLVGKIRREIAWTQDPVSQELLRTALASPDLPRRFLDPEFEPESCGLVHSIVLRVGRDHIRLFSTITTLGTPQDITLQELRIESYHAADAESSRLVRDLLATG